MEERPPFVCSVTEVAGEGEVLVEKVIEALKIVPSGSNSSACLAASEDCFAAANLFWMSNTVLTRDQGKLRLQKACFVLGSQVFIQPRYVVSGNLAACCSFFFILNCTPAWSFPTRTANSF